MTSVFISRVELLPAGETLEEHKKLLKEEADAVQEDKDNKDARTGGLFKGCFKTHPLHGRGPSLQVLRDQEDGVDRCPVCTWELEDGGCTQCGLIFDEAGEVSWGDSFTGFSDMDEMSEHDTAELDAELDMEDVDYDWEDYPSDQASFMMRRFLEGGISAQAAALARRRPLTHSEAGSRRSYSQSIVSDMYGDEMDTVEEEDEEGLEEEEDSEMNDFIDDEEINGSASAASSTPGPTAQPPVNRIRAPGRARRVVEESESSSTISSVIEEEDEDEEDEGPIRRGQRNPAQTRVLNRASGASGARSARAASSSTSTDVSTDELDEDTQALLREEGWGMLQHDDDEMGEDEDEDSDGGRTTVGWEPLANSNDRSRMGGSLTPTADRSRPSAPIRPPSRAGNIHLINASRGLRRRSSVLSASTAHYEDGEADDDDSDQDADIAIAMNTLRTRRSQAQMRNMAAFPNPHVRFGNRTPVQIGMGQDQDIDDNSDTSQPGHGLRGARTQRREYDPRISWMFAAHQRALQEHQMAGALIDVEPRSITPVARPRTANRNRPSPAQAYSPFRPPSRLRTPLMDNTSNAGSGLRMPMSPPRRSAMSPALPPTNGTDERASSIGSSSTRSVVLTPGTSTPNSQYSIDGIAQTQAVAAMDLIDRPESRVSARPPSAAGRRGSANFSPVYPPFHNASMGLHAQGSALPPYSARGNPWAAFVQGRGLRTRASRQLRDQNSTATLRPAGSRANIRESANQPQAVGPQSPRVVLRTQPSRQRLNPQASTRTLRASEHGRPPPSPSQVTQSIGQPAARSPRLGAEERETRVRELIETRMRTLGQTNPPPAPTNNPFTRRAANLGNNTAVQAPTSVQHTRSNSNESMQSANSSGTVSATSTSPALGRRRSNRNLMYAPPQGVLPPPQGAYVQPPVSGYSNGGYPRPRQNSFNTGSNNTNTYEQPLHANARPLHQVTAGPLI